MPNQIISKDKIISEGVKSFINKYIPSVSHLNVILLFYKSPHQEFGSNMIEEHLHLSSDTIFRILTDLKLSNFITSDLVSNQMSSKKGEKSICYLYLSDETKNNFLALIIEAFSKNRNDVIDLILRRK